MLKINEIRMDYEKEQIGITHIPEFSWTLESDKRNVRQDTWELEIAEDKAFEKKIYKSGRVNSDASAQIIPEDVKLESQKKYFARVKVTANGEETEWAETSFVTGILDNSQWKAVFVSAEEEADKDNSKGTYVRNEFTVKKSVKEAYVSVTALGLYHFYLNGRKVGNDELTPGWTSYRKHLCFQTYEVTDYLKEGKNAAGAVLAAGWYKGKMGFEGLEKNRNHYGENTALLAQMVIRYADGTEDLFVTDESWSGADAPVVFAEIYDGEIYDGAKEIKGWAEAECTAGQWKPVRKLDYDFSVLTGQGSGKVSLMDEVKPKKIFETPQGDLVIDFGQNMSALIQVTAAGKKGDVIQRKCISG